MLKLVNSHHKKLIGEDSKLSAHNKKLRVAEEAVSKHRNIINKYRDTLARVDGKMDPDRYHKLSDTLRNAIKSFDKSEENYRKVIASGADLLHMGSGKVVLLVAPPGQVGCSEDVDMQ